MSCSLTTDAVRARVKTVTRRRADTWLHLTAGDRLTLVEKAMGLPKGARQVVLAEVEVLRVDVLPLAPMTLDELAKEGFDTDDPLGISPDEFYEMWLAAHGYGRHPRSELGFEAAVTLCRRIEWRYLELANSEAV